MDTDIQNKIKEFASSPAIFGQCEAIGKEFGLTIDQIGELDAEIRQVLVGNTKPADFATNLQKYLEIDAHLAAKLTEKVNASILAEIKAMLQGAAARSQIAAVEKAGGFEIERPRANLTTGKSINLLEQDSAQPHATDAADTTESKPEIIANIEGISLKEPLVDQLLRGTVATPEKKVLREEPRGPAQPPTPRTGGDPYRESIE